MLVMAALDGREQRIKIQAWFYNQRHGLTSGAVVQMLVLWNVWSYLSWDRLLELHWPLLVAGGGEGTVVQRLNLSSVY